MYGIKKILNLEKFQQQLQLILVCEICRYKKQQLDEDQNLKKKDISRFSFKAVFFSLSNLTRSIPFRRLKMSAAIDW